MARRQLGSDAWGSVGGFWQAQYNAEKKRHASAADRIPDRTRNELTTEEYQYKALEGNTSSLRLVELLPGTRQEDIACRMYETLLGECAGSYEALSYVWGESSEKTPIQVNGRTLEVGSNLRLALLNIRELDKPRVLWIDALCINQADVDERNQQVSIMGQIYGQARRTVVWLRDEEQAHTEAALSMLEALAEDAISHSHKQRPHPDDHREVEDIVHLNNLPVSMIEKDGVADPMFTRYRDDISAVHLLESSWWYRAWTLQEILLAPAAIFVVGRYSIDWDRVRIGTNHGLSLGIWTPITLGILPDPILTPFLSLQLLKLKRQTQDPGESAGQALLELLFQCRFRKASDSRDKIYSLLGLVARNASRPGAPSLGIEANYSAPMETIYTHAAGQMMIESNSLDVLGGCGPPAPDSDLVLPSWVPDWNTAQPASPLLHDALGQQRTTHATAHSKAKPQFIDAGDSTLLIQAHEITTLTALAPALPQPVVDWANTGADKASNDENSNDEKKLNLVAEAAKSGVSVKLLGMFLGRTWKAFGQMFAVLLNVVPLLATFADWEEFATAVPSTNPSAPEPSPARSIAALVRNASNLSLTPTPDEEPQDRLAVYWQTLCTGTYDDTAAAAQGRGRKIATQKLFYSWRASLKPIYEMHRWHADRKLRPLAFVGYIVNTWTKFGEFARFLNGSYGRRLGRGANGYLCLVPGAAEVGDKLVLARGGRVPLVLREDGETGYWRLVGEAYVQGIMDGQAWEEAKCKEFKIR